MAAPPVTVALHPCTSTHHIGEEEPLYLQPFPQPSRTIAATMTAIAPPPSSLAGEGGAALSAAPLQHPQASMKP